jgi:hypothetical protein
MPARDLQVIMALKVQSELRRGTLRQTALREAILRQKLVV